jgi:hypothetical protein
MSVHEVEWSVVSSCQLPTMSGSRAGGADGAGNLEGGKG